MIILQSQGAFVNNPRSGWRPGNLRLSPKDLSFWQASRILWKASVGNIEAVEIGTKALGFGRRSVLCVVYKTSHQKTAKAWFAVSDVKIWSQRIHEVCWLEINETAISSIWDGYGFERYMDTIDGDDCIEIIIELSETERHSVNIQIHDKLLEININGPQGSQFIPLPNDVEASSCKTRYKNGLFYIILRHHQKALSDPP